MEKPILKITRTGRTRLHIPSESVGIELNLRFKEEYDKTLDIKEYDVPLDAAINAPELLSLLKQSVDVLKKANEYIKHLSPQYHQQFGVDLIALSEKTIKKIEG